jgi:cytochrome c556
MKKTLAAGLLLTAFTSAAVAGVITDRQNIMKSFNQANMTLRTMTTPTPPANPNAPPINYVAFDPAVAKTQLQIIIDGAAKLPSLFPAGSDVAAGTETPHAQPAVWTDTATFLANATKLSNDAKAAMAATDQASFTTAWQTLNGDCGSCHRTFRAAPAGRGGGGGAGGPPGGAAPGGGAAP